MTDETADLSIHVDDDLLHPRSDDPYWNESTYIPIPIPEHGVQGGIYFHHRPNIGVSAGGPHFWDKTGEDIYNCMHWDWNPSQPMPPACQMYEFELDNSLRVETIELQKSYRLTYSRAGCEVDLAWQSVLPPVGLRQVNGKANPTFAGFIPDGDGELSTGHYDHPGLIQGHVTVEGKTYDVKGYSMRDHSWGPRRLVPIRIGYSWAIASPDHMFHAPSRSHLPIDDDPIIGTVEQIGGGFYIKDGQQAELIEGTRTIVERDAQGRPVREVIDAVDSLGRRLHADGVNELMMRWTAHTDWFDWYGSTHWQVDNATVWGETHDFYPFQVQRRFHRMLQAASLK